MEIAKRSGKGCLIAVGIAILVAMLAGLLMIGGCVWMVKSAAGGGGCEARHATQMGVDESPAMNEVWAWGRGDTKVVMISVRGMIMLDEEESLFGTRLSSASFALNAIRRATHDPEVRAIILDIDSGGGGITASDVIYEALQKFKDARKGRQVVALMDDVAASGAYYIALAADSIIAHPTTITGSIGVLMQSFNLKELALKIGVKDVTIKSGANKDMLNPLGDLSDVQRLMLQQIVDQLHARFVKLVAENRELPEEKVREIADGRIFTADQALGLGLIDEIGYFQDAVDATASLLTVDEVKVYRYEHERSFSDFFKVQMNANPLSAWLSKPSPETRLLYRWAF